MSSIVSANDNNGSGFSWSWLYWVWKVLLHILLTCFDTSIHSKIVQYGHVNERHFDLVWTNKSKRVIGWSGHISWNNIPEALWNQNNFLSFLESKPVWQLLLPSFFRDENLSMLNFSSHFFLSNFWRLELFFFASHFDLQLLRWCQDFCSSDKFLSLWSSHWGYQLRHLKTTKLWLARKLQLSTKKWIGEVIKSELSRNYDIFW